jgi:hypothetical protein
MSVFKLCQPCRAYNLFYDQNNNEHHRALENNGDGEAQERYNCYDDAGYTNVDQCYKFETHTRLAPAGEYDLSLASDQGTILMIKANGTTYGSGGYTSPYAGWDWRDFDIMSLSFDQIDPETIMYLSFGSFAIVWMALLLFFHHRHRKKCKNVDASLASSFYDDDDNGEYDSDSSDSTRASEHPKRSIYSPPSLEITNTTNTAPKGAVCSQTGINPSSPELRSFYTLADYTMTIDDSTLDGNDKYRPIGCVNYSSLTQSEGKSFETKSPGTIQTDSQDEASLHIDSSRTEVLFDLEAIDESRSEDEQNTAHPDITTTPSGISSCASINHRASRMRQWHARQQELAQKQGTCLELTEPQIPEKVEEEDALGDALQRLQQRIMLDQQNDRASHSDETTAASSNMSSIV